MRAIGKILLVLAALLIFLFGLEILKGSAKGVMPLMETLRMQGVLNTTGLGWIMAYCVLSGSPVAAVALALFGAGTIDNQETLGMIAGSRFGGSFIVLLLGAINYFRRKRDITAVGTGVLCLLVTWSVLLPACVIGYTLLMTGLVDGARMPTPPILISLFDMVYGPAVRFLLEAIHPVILFVAGVVILIGSFGLFDRALPQIDPESSRFRSIADVVYRPKVMFALGVAITLITLSVSVSLGLLVPLSAKGYVRRENIVPYIMGANISTFVDTLLVAILVGMPQAFTVVLALVLGVALFSLVILAGFYRSYRDGIEWCLERITRSRYSFVVFVLAITAVPVVLMLL